MKVLQVRSSIVKRVTLLIKEGETVTQEMIEIFETEKVEDLLHARA